MRKVPMKKIPIGVHDFKELLDDNFFYIDKTFLIKELLDLGNKVVLMPRPRRFGKTLNMSMLRYFFEKTANNANRYLFDNLAISSQPEIMQQQGNYPVINLTFKAVKETTWEKAYDKICELIETEVCRHEAIATHEKLTTKQRTNIARIIAQDRNHAVYSSSLATLSAALKNAYGSNVIILIDEYDAAINASYTHGYYEEMISFIRNFLCDGLKDNPALEKGFLTGILRVAKEGIFSGINNLDVLTITQPTAADKFGFTQPEVENLLKTYALSHQAADIKTWYNGYNFGNPDSPVTIYNPWSILNCIQKKGNIALYWANTSDNALIKNIIAASHDTVKQDFELLMSGQTIQKSIDDSIVLTDIENNDSGIWSLLLMSGYLTTTKHFSHRLEWFYSLKIPNLELMTLFRQLIRQAIKTVLAGSPKINSFITALLTGDAAIAQESLQSMILASASVYDFTATEPERSYHLFILGMLVALTGEYDVTSNRESGLGRYDVMIIPNNPQKPGVIIEFKKIHPLEKSLEQAADDALDQINNKKYATQLQARGVTQIYAYGIAFRGKELLVKMDI